MSGDLAFWNDRRLGKVSPLIKNMAAWEAFLALIDYEESKLLGFLLGRPDHDTLVRVAGKYELLQELKRAQERILGIEKGLKDGSDQR